MLCEALHYFVANIPSFWLNRTHPIVSSEKYSNNIKQSV